MLGARMGIREKNYLHKQKILESILRERDSMQTESHGDDEQEMNG